MPKMLIFLQKQNFKTAFYLSISSALLIVAKVFGVVPPILFLLLYFVNSIHKDKINKHELKFILYIVFLVIIFSIFNSLSDHTTTWEFFFMSSIIGHISNPDITEKI